MERVRKLRLKQGLARRLSAVRALYNVEDVFAPSLEAIAEVEEALSCTIPEAVLGFFAAGLAESYGNRLESPRAMRELTRALKAEFEEWRESGGSVAWAPQCIVFSKMQSDYLAFSRKAGASSESILYIDHEVGFLEPPARMSLSDHLEDHLRDSGVDLEAAEPFEAHVVTEPPQEKEPERYVLHPSFGRGRLAEENGEKWTVEFEDGVTRKILARFLTSTRPQ